MRARNAIRTQTAWNNGVFDLTYKRYVFFWVLLQHCFTVLQLKPKCLNMTHLQTSVLCKTKQNNIKKWNVSPPSYSFYMWLKIFWSRNDITLCQNWGRNSTLFRSGTQSSYCVVATRTRWIIDEQNQNINSQRSKIFLFFLLLMLVIKYPISFHMSLIKYLHPTPFKT